jgi:hypothetical protein
MQSNLLPQELHKSRLQHEIYQMELSFWSKFVIWSYTIGSGTVNMYLLGVVEKSNIPVWADRIARTFRQASTGMKISIPKVYQEYIPFLRGQSNLSYQKKEELLILYIRNLQFIIKQAPPLTGDIVVYKASSPYPGLQPGKVHQKPFNSTSYRVDMNYSLFLPKNGLCCMHRIEIKKGAQVLILSPILSAYPDEAEIILPHGVDFNVKSISSMALNFPVQTPEVTFKTVQNEPYTIGPIYFYNYKIDCSTEKRNVTLYNSVLNY